MTTKSFRGSLAGARCSAAALAAVLTLTVAGGVARADEKELPPGPIHDRHELMEGVGANAKKIGAAAKAGKPEDAAAPAEAIAAALEKFPSLFPAGSESPLSRAKPEVWTNKAEFDRMAAEAREAALAVASAAKSGEDLKASSGKMFQACKGCHEHFRKPEEGE